MVSEPLLMRWPSPPRSSTRSAAWMVPSTVRERAEFSSTSLPAPPAITLPLITPSLPAVKPMEPLMVSSTPV